MAKVLSKKQIRKIKKQWIEALRSGDYKQARGRLRKERKKKGEKYGYCCLGVLCEVTGEDPGFGVVPNSVNHPVAHRVYLAFSDLNLTVLNDEKRWSFNKIADKLEASKARYQKQDDE